MLEIYLLMVKDKEKKELNKETAEMHEYRNDWKYGREHGFVPNIPFPRWMKKSE